MEALHATLSRRKRPEDVAQMVLEQLQDRLNAQEAKILRRAAKGSLKRRLWSYTSMAEQFIRPVGAQRQVNKAQELFATAYPLTPAQCDDPARVEQLVRHISLEIGKAVGQNDFVHDRLNGEARQAAGLDLSRRRYNKLWRMLQRMETKLHAFARDLQKWQFQQIGKSGLASVLGWEEFGKDENTACFIAYYTARANLRSAFTVGGQQRASDEIAAMLLERCRRGESTNWCMASRSATRIWRPCSGRPDTFPASPTKH